ncbi:MAG: hypothetical protein AB1938_13430 [Myxococcota bacterium]
MRTRFLLGVLAALSPSLSLASEETERCFDAIENILPTYFKQESLEKTIDSFRSWICVETAEARTRRKQSGLSLDILGLGLLDFSNDDEAMEQKRRKACSDQARYLNHYSLLQTLQTDDTQKVRAIGICEGLAQKSLAREALSVDWKRAGDKLLINVRRLVVGENQVLAVKGLASHCSTSSPLPATLKAQETFSFSCDYDTRKGVAAFIETSIGMYTVTLPRSEVFTARSNRTETLRVAIGYTPESCAQTCNAHNTSPCKTTVKIRNSEAGVEFGSPFSFRCMQPTLGRCKYYATAQAPVLAADNQSALQEWTMRSRPTSVCLRVMRYRVTPKVVLEERKVELGPDFTTLDEGVTELIDERGFSFSPQDERFDFDGGKIRLRF